jgi:signal transduction histidine kinase
VTTAAVRVWQTNRASRIWASVAGLIGLATLVGWSTGPGWLDKIPPSNIGESVDTGLAFVALSGAWLTSRRLLGLSLTWFVVALCAAGAVEHLSATTFGLDALLHRAHTAYADQPGGMSVASILGLLDLAACRLLLYRGYVRVVVGIVAAHLLLTELVLLGYLYGVGTSQRSEVLDTFNLGTVVAMLALGVATWLAVPSGFAHWIVHGKDPGAITARRLLPIAWIALPILGYLLQRPATARGPDSNLAWAAFVVASGLLVSVVAIRVTTRLAELDRRRDDLVRQLQDRDAYRSQLLETEQARVAVFEERNRIAADLHDHVVQRLFGLGLTLAAAARVDDGHSELIESAVTDIDAAILELRTTIFSIKNPSTGTDPAEVLKSCVDDAARLLGHQPHFDVGGDLACIPATVTVQLEAVLREALSNVVRHAHGTHAEVHLRADPSSVELVVSDDGVGMDLAEVGHQSGTANIRNRALNLGGNATWTRTDPHGTTLTWTAPLR